MKSFLCLIVCILYNCIKLINAHGRLWDPAARPTAWRVNASYPAYYDDNQMFCGGIQVQWETNGGKCSICGESFTANPKLFEKNGQYYTGRSIKTYTKGQVINVRVELTANHLGWFEFRICNIDGWLGDATQECLDRTLLKDTNGKTRFSVSGGVNNYNYNLVLPKELSCNQCVFQWKYHTGNSWGVDPVTGQECLGCGDRQEEFYGCSDVTISGNESPNTVTIGPTNAPVATSQSLNINSKTTVMNSSGTRCYRGDGFYADVANGCKTFYICVNTGTASATVYTFECPAGLLFDEKIKGCNYPQQVLCSA